MRRHSHVNLFDAATAKEHQPHLSIIMATIMATTLVAREVLCIDTIYSKP